MNNFECDIIFVLLLKRTWKLINQQSYTENLDVDENSLRMRHVM